MNAVVLSHVHQGKYGYHPCDKETYLKLKALNKLYVEALRQKAAWDRWNRKLPKNRFCRRKVRDAEGNISSQIVPMVEPALNSLLKKLVYAVVFKENAELIGDEYRHSRYPHQSDKGIRKLRLSEDVINNLLQSC
jgi:hypothetical protein